MDMMTNRLFKLLPELIIFFFAIVLGTAFLSPLLYLNNQDKAADFIQQVYKYLCHQRVERSLFIGGEEGLLHFYTLDELREKGAIPQSNPYVDLVHSTEFYQYPFVGNDTVGYKVAFCIRDLAMYSGLILAGIFTSAYYFKRGKVLKIKPLYLLFLMVPMAIDGVFQTMAELFGWDWVSDAYIDNIEKRIVTGFLFGVGFALLVFPLLRENVNMVNNNEKSGDQK